MAKSRIEIPVKPTLDTKGLAQFVAQWQKVGAVIQKQSAGMGALKKGAVDAVKAVQKMGGLRRELGKNLSQEAKNFVSELETHAKRIESKGKMAERYKKKKERATNPVDREKYAKKEREKYNEIKKETDSLKRKRIKGRRYEKEIDKEGKIRHEMLQQRQRRGAYGSRGDKQLSGDISGVLRNLGGGKAGGVQALKGLGDIVGKGVMRSMANAGPGMMGGMGGMMGSGMAMGAMAGGAAIVALIAGASDHFAKLNKAMTEGLGLANDMTGNVDDYGNALEKIQEDATNVASSFKSIGKGQEDYMKIMNAYARETTGSVIKTQQTFEKYVDGPQIFAKSIMGYGQALGMAETEVAKMAGKWVTEVGYGTGEVLNVMGDVVKMAQTSSLPVEKFMSIFHQTTADVSLYNNRMEELTSTMGTLARFMDPQRIKEFMDAFKANFEDMSFRERLGHVLVAGVTRVSKLLEKDFKQNIDHAAKNMGSAIGDNFKKAFNVVDKKGKQMGVDTSTAYLAIAAAQNAGKMSAAEAENARRTVMAENVRRQGGALNVASALKGGTMSTLISTLESEVVRLTGKGLGEGGIQGIAEQVAEQRGMSQKQINALNSMIGLSQQFKASIQSGASTGYMDIDKALAAIAKEKFGERQKERAKQGKKEETLDLRKEMANLSHEEIRQGMANTVRYSKKMDSAADIAEKHYEMTTGISEKMQNIVGYYLEKIFQFIKPLVRVVESIANWLSRGDDHKEEVGKTGTYARQADLDYYTKGVDPKDKKSMDQAKAKHEAFQQFAEKWGANVGNYATQAENLSNYYGKTVTKKNYLDQDFSAIELDENIKRGLIEGLEHTRTWGAPKTQLVGSRSILSWESSIQKGMLSKESLTELIAGLSDRGRASVVAYAKDATPTDAGMRAGATGSWDALTLKDPGAMTKAERERAGVEVNEQQESMLWSFADADQQAKYTKWLESDQSDTSGEIAELRKALRQKAIAAGYNPTNVDFTKAGGFSSAHSAAVPDAMGGGGDIGSSEPPIIESTMPGVSPALQATAARNEPATQQATIGTAKTSTEIDKKNARMVILQDKMAAALEELNLGKDDGTGIKLQRGFLVGDFKSVMTQAVEWGVSGPLLKHAILSAKLMRTDNMVGYTEGLSALAGVNTSSFGGHAVLTQAAEMNEWFTGATTTITDAVKAITASNTNTLTARGALTSPVAVSPESGAGGTTTNTISIVVNVPAGFDAEQAQRVAEGAIAQMIASKAQATP